jgi:hypothetical protein
VCNYSFWGFALDVGSYFTILVLTALLLIRKDRGKMLNLDITQLESTFVIEIVEVEHFSGFPDCAGQVRVATAKTWKPKLHMAAGCKG